MLVIIPATLYAASINLPMSAGMVVGYALGMILNPDADQPSITYADGIAMRHLGFIGALWVGWWTVYAVVFKSMHRHFLTHFPFVSTAIRMVYMLWWLYLLDIDWNWGSVSALVGMWIALSASDMGHFLSDLWFSDSENSYQNLSNNRRKSTKIRKN